MKKIIISGTPGTGKTSIANKIAQIEDARVISLNESVINEKLYLKYDDKRDTYIIDSEKVISFLKEVYAKYKHSNLDLWIVESHFVDILPNDFYEHIFILRCHPDVLKKRLEARNYKRSKIIENVQSEILGTCANFLFEKELTIPLYEIDTSHKTIEECSDLILELTNSTEIQQNYLLGNIDWLEELFENDRLGEFFD